MRLQVILDLAPPAVKGQDKGAGKGPCRVAWAGNGLAFCRAMGQTVPRAGEWLVRYPEIPKN